MWTLLLVLLAWSPLIQSRGPVVREPTELDLKQRVLLGLEDHGMLLYGMGRAYVEDGFDTVYQKRLDCENCDSGKLGADCLKRESELILRLKREWESSTDQLRARHILNIANMGYEHRFPYSPGTSEFLARYLVREGSVEVQAAVAVALGYGAHSGTVAAVLSEYCNDILERLAAAKLEQQATSEQYFKLWKKLGLHKKKSSNPRRAPSKDRLAKYEAAKDRANIARTDHEILQFVLLGCVNALGRVRDDRCTEILLICCSDEEYLSFPELYPALLYHGTRSSMAKAIECFERWESLAVELDKEIEKLSKSKMGPMPKSWHRGRKAWREYYPQWKSSTLVRLNSERQDMKTQRVDLWWALDKFAGRQGMPESGHSLIAWKEWFAKYGEQIPASHTSK